MTGGTAMAVMDYWTQDGLANYGFSIEFQPDKGWRVYIVFRPLYQDNNDNPGLPHQVMDGSGRSYVNWPPGNASGEVTMRSRARLPLIGEGQGRPNIDTVFCNL
jgi:hypothetical protein